MSTTSETSLVEQFESNHSVDAVAKMDEVTPEDCDSGSTCYLTVY